MRTVCFYGDILSYSMKFFDKCGINLQRWFSACQYNESGFMSGSKINDFIESLASAMLMLCIAERACKVASSKADEHCRSANMVAFALKRIEQLIHPHGQSFLLSSEEVLRS